MIVSKSSAEKFLGKKLKGLGGGKRSFYVLSADGSKNLGGPYTRPGAVKRLQQVEYYKKNPDSHHIAVTNPRMPDKVQPPTAGRRIWKEMRGARKFTIKEASKKTGLTESEAASGLHWLQNHGKATRPDSLGRSRVISMNPSSFQDRPHNWDEVLISKDGKRVTRKQILNYYKRNEKKIWPFLKGQTVMVIIGVKRNEFIRRRHEASSRFIKLTKLKGIDDPNSFEYWIHRRTIEFHPTLTTKATPILWLDLDMHSTKATEARKKLLAKMKRSVPTLKKVFREMGVRSVKVYSSGASGGIHLEGDLDKPKSVDALRRKFTKRLAEVFADDPVFTTGIAKPGQIRLDTTTIHKLGSLRAPYSMTVTGSSKKPIK